MHNGYICKTEAHEIEMNGFKGVRMFFDTIDSIEMGHRIRIKYETAERYVETRIFMQAGNMREY